MGSVQAQSDCRWDRVAMRGVYPATTIAPVSMSAGNRGSRGVLGKKCPKNQQKQPVTPWQPCHSPGSRCPLAPQVPIPRVPGIRRSRSYRNKEVKHPREARIKKILRRGPGYRPPNPPGPMLAGPVISGEPLIPGCPGWTGRFGERYLLFLVSRFFWFGLPEGLCLGSCHQMSPSTSDCRAHASPLFIPDLLPKESRVA